MCWRRTLIPTPSRHFSAAETAPLSGRRRTRWAASPPPWYRSEVVGLGHPDVLAPNTYSDTVTAFFGRGDGTLVGPPAYSVGGVPTSMVLADFNGDGKPDLAVAAGGLWIILSQGGGGFKTPVQIASPANTVVSSVAAGDFNGDGKQDLVIGANYGSGVYVLLGNGDGTFQAPVAYPMGGSITSVAVADFNGDGKPDIAACGMGGV